MYFETKQNQKPNKSKERTRKILFTHTHTHTKICCKHKTNAGLFVIYNNKCPILFLFVVTKI